MTPMNGIRSASFRSQNAVIALLVVVLSAGLPLAVWLDLRNLTESALRRQAADINLIMTGIRGYYADNIVGRILASPELAGSIPPRSVPWNVPQWTVPWSVPQWSVPQTKVRSNYIDIPGAIPVPATLSIELGRVISERQSNITYRFVSDFPFKNRAPHELDSFERNVLGALRQKPDQQFDEVSSSLVSERVRHIVPIVMSSPCVSCHNSDPDSPRHDWKVGDVRGIQEISVSQSLATNIFSFRYLLIYFAISGASGLAIIAMQSRQAALIRSMNQELARQHHIDESRLDWLQQLARFLRHEVRQPVAQINSSIEVIQLTSDHDGHLTPYINAAVLGARDVWNLIERASRATDARAFVRQSQPQSVDLSNLLDELVRGHQQTYSGTHFNLEASVPVQVNADPALVNEAIANLLANAASFAADQSVVEIVLEQDGTCATIKVRNKGPLLSDDPEALFGPFASTRSGPSSEHLGLGLYLVRLIAEQHGGTAAIMNLEDKSGVEASIRLPLAH
jgi:signal transduction histidine kinase